MGSFKDLYKFNPSTKESSLFLEGYYFTDIKSNMYVGATNLNGIILFNNTRVLQKITENNGLISNQIKKITIENENVFWASTESGLSRVQFKKTSNVKINNFTTIDGLPSNQIAGCIIRGDSIFIGTSKGLGILSISKLLGQEKYIKKKVIINSVIIGGKKYVGDYQNLTGKTPKNVVSFNLSFLDYISRGKISYRYKLEGLNDFWESSNSSKIIFNALPPGKYVFKAYGIGFNGKQSYAYTELPFEIKPQFWQTMLILLAASLLTISTYIYFQRSRNKKLTNLLTEKRIAELELQAIKAQINPHFIYNCLNSIKLLLYKKGNPEAESYLKIFPQMLRKTLYYSEKTFISIEDEIAYLTLYLDMEKLRVKNQFDYKITTTAKVDTWRMIPSLLIQPFVENAIKHGVSRLTDRKGHLNILFDYFDSTLCIIIEDNGIGFTYPSALKEDTGSFGIKLSIKRIETFKQLFNTDIVLEIVNLTEKKQVPGTQIKLLISHETHNKSMHHR